MKIAMIAFMMPIAITTLKQNENAAVSPLSQAPAMEIAVALGVGLLVHCAWKPGLVHALGWVASGSAILFGNLGAIAAILVASVLAPRRGTTSRR